MRASQVVKTENDAEEEKTKHAPRFREEQQPNLVYCTSKSSQEKENLSASFVPPFPQVQLFP